jgi:16S rRNA (cytosine967-C5)-methyltransferase
VSNALGKLIKGIDLSDHLITTYNLNISILDQFDSISSDKFFPSVFINNINIAPTELEDLCNSLNKEATTDIRIIKNKSEVEKDLIKLNARYYTNILPNCLKLKDNVNLDSTTTYRNGLFEIQDEGSQLIALSLSPNKGESILDYCAGGGGKSLHIAHLSHDSANITATDIRNNRLNESKRRVSKLGLKSISVKQINKVDESNQLFDKILIDAPCTGSGTVRRAPDIRVTITESSIDNYHKLQIDILSQVADKLKKGGILVYSTCSLFDKENDQTIAHFLSLHTDFKAVSTIKILNNEGIDTSNFTSTEHGIQTFTHKTDMDSFYISTLVKE